MSPVPEAVRYQVAAARGLSEDAASFLTGESVEELEHSADALAKLLGAGDDHGDQAMTAEADLFRNPPAAKAERQRRLLALFAGPTPRPRDASGRYAATGSFDGGAQPAKLTARAPESHSETVLRLAAESKRGHSGF